MSYHVNIFTHGQDCYGHYSRPQVTNESMAYEDLCFHLGSALYKYGPPTVDTTGQSITMNFGCSNDEGFEHRQIIFHQREEK